MPKKSIFLQIEVVCYREITLKLSRMQLLSNETKNKNKTHCQRKLGEKLRKKTQQATTLQRTTRKYYYIYIDCSHKDGIIIIIITITVQHY